MAIPIFDHAYPKIIEITFGFLEFPPACKTSDHLFILESFDQNDHPHPKIF